MPGTIIMPTLAWVDTFFTITAGRSWVCIHICGEEPVRFRGAPQLIRLNHIMQHVLECLDDGCSYHPRLSLTGTPLLLACDGKELTIGSAIKDTRFEIMRPVVEDLHAWLTHTTTGDSPKLSPDGIAIVDCLVDQNRTIVTLTAPLNKRVELDCKDARGLIDILLRAAQSSHIQLAESEPKGYIEHATGYDDCHLDLDETKQLWFSCEYFDNIFDCVDFHACRTTLVRIAEEIKHGLGSKGVAV